MQTKNELLTSLEEKLVKSYMDDDYVSDYATETAAGWENVEASTWSGHICAKMDGKSFSGTISSLVKKGIVWTNGDEWGLTPKGIATAKLCSPRLPVMPVDELTTKLKEKNDDKKRI